MTARMHSAACKYGDAFNKDIEPPTLVFEGK